ncbi:MAG: TPM domain-containing protein, partial [Pseudomonadota bacterium]
MTRNLAVLAAFIMSMVVAAPAWAQNCDTMVVDEAGRLGASGVATVEAAGNRLVNAGADVRVRVIPSASAVGNLDQYMARLQAECASWRAADGGRKNNLLVILLSMDRQSGVFFGEQYRSALDDRTATIRTGSMNPRFRDGDFAGGLAAGLDASGRFIAAAAAPPVNTTTPVIVQTQPSQPTDLTGLWSVLMWGLGLIALGALAYLVVVLSRARAKRRAAQQKAQAVRSSCSNRITELDDPISLVGARLNRAAQAVSEEDAAPLKASLEALKGEANRATAQYGDLQQSANNPDRGGLSADEYDAMAAAFQSVLDKLDKVREGREKLEKDIAGLQSLIDAARPLIDALDKDVDAAAVAVVQVQELGYKTEAVEAVLTEAVKAQEEAGTAMAAKRFGAVKTICDRGSKKAKDASSQASGLPARKNALDQGVTALKSRISQVAQVIKDTRPVFEAIASEFVEGSWAHVKGNGTEAENRIDAATNASVETAVLAAMDRQEWQKAEDTLGQAKAWLDEAESFMRSIVSLKGNLEQAKRDALPEIDAAQADIDKATAYEREHDDDIRDSIKGDIAEARRVLAGAREELAKEKPDYFFVVEQAKLANASADKILDQSQNEHEAAERKRKRAVSSVRDATAAISRAKEYIEDHSSDV